MLDCHRLLPRLWCYIYSLLWSRRRCSVTSTFRLRRSARYKMKTTYWLRRPEFSVRWDSELHDEETYFKGFQWDFSSFWRNFRNWNGKTPLERRGYLCVSRITFGENFAFQHLVSLLFTVVKARILKFSVFFFFFLIMLPLCRAKCQCSVWCVKLAESRDTFRKKK